MSIKNGVYSFTVNAICLVLLVGNLVYLIVAWGNLPEQIPAHFDSSGNVTRYGGKGELLILPIMNFLMYIGVSVVERFPQIWNTGVKATEENKWRLYRIIKNMLVTIKMEMVALIVFISINQSLGANLPGWIIPIIPIVITVSIVFFIVKLIRAR